MILLDPQVRQALLAQRVLRALPAQMVWLARLAPQVQQETQERRGRPVRLALRALPEQTGRPVRLALQAQQALTEQPALRALQVLRARTVLPVRLARLAPQAQRALMV